MTNRRSRDQSINLIAIGKSAGREWFLTHTKFLDQIAATLDLGIEIINEGEYDDK